MRRIPTALAVLLLLHAAGNVWALPMLWDETTGTARVLTAGPTDGAAKEMHGEEAAGGIWTVLIPASQRGALVLLGLGSLGVAVYSKRRRNAKNDRSCP